MTFECEDEDTSHPEVNLWLWNCRLAAGCIDLGLHQCHKPSNACASREERMEVEDQGYDLYESASGGKFGGGVKIPVDLDDQFFEEDSAGDRQMNTDSEDEGEDEDSHLSELYRNTFRSAFVLDRRISEVRKRPTAIHEGDVDRRLIEDLL